MVKQRPSFYSDYACDDSNATKNIVEQNEETCAKICVLSKMLFHIEQAPDKIWETQKNKLAYARAISQLFLNFLVW